MVIEKINKLIKYGFILGLILSMGLGQSSGYLAQKLMIENNLRKRISDALEKIIDNRKYVIDVSVDLEISSAVEVSAVLVYSLRPLQEQQQE